jgi:hypothetical protein
LRLDYTDVPAMLIHRRRCCDWLPVTKQDIVGYAGLSAACEKQVHKRQNGNHSECRFILSLPSSIPLLKRTRLNPENRSAQ